MVFMTIAGASSLNILGLDTVIIVDEWYTQVLRSGGVKALEKCHLGNNELLQMGGRVNGRAIGGEIHILSDRRFEFHQLKAVAPEFVLGGDLERVALTCAKLAIDARELDLIGGLDHDAYSRIVERFVARGLIVQNGTTALTPLGIEVERLPVKPHWGEMLVAAIEVRDEALVNLLAVISSTEQLFKLTRRDWDRCSEVVVRGSDHLTAYNIVAAALRQFGYTRKSTGGTEYALKGNFVKGHGENRIMGPFVAWCNDNGFSGREIGNVLLSMKSVYRALRLNLPQAEEFELVRKELRTYDTFIKLLASVQSLDFVRNEQNSRVGRVFSSQGGMASATSTLGEIRFWKDRRGCTRASIEGTDIPGEIVAQCAKKTPVSLLGITSDGETFLVRYKTSFAGEDIGSINLEHTPGEVPEEFRKILPSVFTDYLSSLNSISEDNLMRPDLKKVLRENLRRQAQARALNDRTGLEPFKVFSQIELSRMYAEALNGARRISEVKEPDALLLPALEEKLVNLVLASYPDSISVAGSDFKVEYRQGYSPRISLQGESVSENHWRNLPNELIKLPSGQIVEVVVSFRYNQFSDTDISKLKIKVSNYLNQKQWDAWYDRPEIEIPTPEAAGSIVPFLTTVYGQCVATGEELKAFGTVVPDSYRYYRTDPHFKAQWYRDKAEAERARDLSVQRLEDILAAAKRLRDEEEAATRQMQEAAEARVREEAERIARDEADRKVAKAEAERIEANKVRANSAMGLDLSSLFGGNVRMESKKK